MQTAANVRLPPLVSNTPFTENAIEVLKADVHIKMGPSCGGILDGSFMSQKYICVWFAKIETTTILHQLHLTMVG